MEMVELFVRPHGHPLIIPKVIQAALWRQVLILICFCRRCKKENKQVLVFVPRRNDCLWMTVLLNFFVKTKGIHSQTEDKDRILEDYRQKKIDVLVCTTLLERGITIPSVQVAVFEGQHVVYTAASLIQIFGRIGRSMKDPSGKGICLCQYASSSIRECVRILKQMNASV